MKVSKRQFADLKGQAVNEITLKNDNGMEVSCIEYGCVITKILVPDRNGKVENVAIGFDTLEEYIEHSPYFGAVVGRVAGRIKGAAFELEGESYQLQANEGPNSLHSGETGFSHQIWNSQVKENEDEIAVVFTYTSPDGEGGFPGTVHMSVTYKLNNDNKLSIVTEGETDKTTLLNVTNHSYFNLSGDLKTNILNHTLILKSDGLIEIGEDLLPTGNILEVAGTPFDFSQPKKIGQDIHDTHVQIERGGGYDHPLLLSENGAEPIVLQDEESGRKLTVKTDQPCVVLYTSNMLEGDFEIRGTKAGKHLGVCLETQGVPDAIHHPNFPSIVLKKGEKYHTVTHFLFN